MLPLQRKKMLSMCTRAWAPEFGSSRLTALLYRLTSASLRGGLRLFEGLHRIGGEHCSDASLTTTPCRLKLSSPLRVSADRSLKTESESIVTYSGPASCNTKHGEGQFNRGSAEPQSESNTYKRESSGMSHQSDHPGGAAMLDTERRSRHAGTAQQFNWRV